MDKIETRVRAIDRITDGGLPTGTITQIFGEKALGKSIVSLQAAFSCASTGHSAIILDTEQSYFSYLVPYWGERFAKRFGREIPVVDAKLERVPKVAGKRREKAVTRSQLMTGLSGALSQMGVSFMESHLESIADILSPDFETSMETKQPSVIVLQMPEVVDLLNLHGVDAGKEVSSGGRVELRLRRTPVYQSTLYDLVSKTDAKLLVYDSISAPLKASFPSTQDLPARSAGLSMLLSHSQRMCVDLGIAVVVTSHVSIDPINPWNRRPYGGVTLGHEAKFSLELTKEKSKRNDAATEIDMGEPDEASSGDDDAGTGSEGIGGEAEKRRVWVARHPALGEYSRYGYATIDSEGVH